VHGLGRADSVAMDFHKMMAIPAPTTALVFRRAADSYRTFAQRAQYLWDENETEEWYHYAKRNFECTKRMMSLLVYAVWRSHGQAFFAQNLERSYDLARRFAGQIEARPGFELALPPQSNIVCFRYQRPGMDPNQLNPRLRAALVEQGRYYLVQTQLRGQWWLRCTLMNPFTTEADLAGLLDQVAEQARHLAAASPP